MVDRALPLAAIVVNYNGGPSLGRLVRSLAVTCAQVIVVDNDSDDGSLDTLPDATVLTVLKQPRNLGYARAVNLGLERVQQTWTLLINPDCELQPDTLHALLERMHDSECAAAGVRVINPDGREQRASRRNLPTWSRLWREILRLPSGVNLRNRAEGVQRVEAVSGAFVLIRTQVFRELNGLDEGYFLHCEDLDLFARLREAGHCLLWHGDLQVVHHKGGAGCSYLEVERHKHAGMRRYFDRHMAAGWPWLLRWPARWFIGLHLLWVHLRLTLGWQGVRR